MASVDVQISSSASVVVCSSHDDDNKNHGKYDNNIHGSKISNSIFQSCLVATSHDLGGNGNFPQGCLFSPDGLCVLTSTVSDCTLRLYNTIHPTTKQQQEQQWKTILSCKVAETVRSYDWYPYMKSSDHNSCCFLATCRDQPVHLFDAYTGTVRATYCPYNKLDEMESPSIVKFSPNGQKIYTCGFRSDRVMHIFDTSIPGRSSSSLRLGKTRRSKDGQKGLVSALALAHSAGNNNIFVVGTYAPGSIYAYDDRMGQEPAETILNGVCVVGHGRSHSRKKKKRKLWMLGGDDPTTAATTTSNSKNGNFHDGKDHDNHDNHDNHSDNNNDDIFSMAKTQWYQSRARSGITQLQFCPDSNEYILYSTSRKSDTILAWDLRVLSCHPDYQSYPLRGIGHYHVDSNTNQRLQFDISADNNYLFCAGRDQCVRIYDISSSFSSSSDDDKLVGTIRGFDDVVNGVSFYPSSSLWGIYNNNNNDIEDMNDPIEEEGKSLCYGMLAVSTGSRRFPSEQYYDTDNDNNNNNNTFDIDNNNNTNTFEENTTIKPPGHLYLYSLNKDMKITGCSVSADL